PFRTSPPETDCAGEARARSGVSSGRWSASSRRSGEARKDAPRGDSQHDAHGDDEKRRAGLDPADPSPLQPRQHGLSYASRDNAAENEDRREAEAEHDNREEPQHHPSARDGGEQNRDAPALAHDPAAD